mmetsp:Transcript_32074/g.102627  ORF Transcript_32074/g.102627 Transcript_32074/m.102627 type:complete len:124 (-) Transcript_32074:122-493(-)
MPQHADKTMSSRVAGTMIEAAVAAVHENGDHEAISDLAEHLVRRALEEPAGASGLQHAKQKLLELGGTVTAERDPASPDHAPVFVAVAELGGQRISIRAAGRKVDVEKRAAAQILKSVFASEY